MSKQEKGIKIGTKGAKVTKREKALKRQILQIAVSYIAVLCMPTTIAQTYMPRFDSNESVVRTAPRYSSGRAILRALDREEMGACKSLRELSWILASAEQNNGLHFHFLASQFHVSAVAIAIQLEEFGLVEVNS